MDPQHVSTFLQIWGSIAPVAAAVAGAIWQRHTSRADRDRQYARDNELHAEQSRREDALMSLSRDQERIELLRGMFAKLLAQTSIASNSLILFVKEKDGKHFATHQSALYEALEVLNMIVITAAPEPAKACTALYKVVASTTIDPSEYSKLANKHRNDAINAIKRDLVFLGDKIH